MKIAFTTSNLLKKEKFKLMTTIYDRKGKLFVRKSVVNSFGIPHLRQIASFEELMGKYKTNFKFAKTLKKTKNYIDYEYLDYPSLTQLIEKSLMEREFDKAFGLVGMGLEALEQINPISVNPYKSKEFTSLFDPKKQFDKGQEEICASLGLLDLKHDNLLLDSSKTLYLIDYEWAYPFPISLKFIKFRSLLYLCISLQLIIDTLCSPDLPCYKLPGNVLIPKSWYDLNPLEDFDVERFFHYENKFQNFVNLIPSPSHSAKLDFNLFTSSQMNDLGKNSGNANLLELELRTAKHQREEIQKELDSIKSSKFFRTWRQYHRLKEKIVS